MIEGIDFSAAGDALTDFEVRLLQTTTDESPWVLIGRRLLAELGLAAGARAFGIILDEIGGEKPHIPKRRHLFVGLWRGMRDALVCELSARPGWSAEDIAEELGISARRVRELRVRRSGGRHRRGRREIPRP